MRKGHGRSGSRAPGGLTLAELLVGLGMASVLATAGALQIPRFLGSVRVPVAARQLATDLHVARATAVARNTRAQVTFTPLGYRVRYDTGEPHETHARLPGAVRIVTVPRSGTLRFWPTGLADNGTVVLASAAGTHRTIVVNQRGRISVR